MESQRKCVDLSGDLNYPPVGPKRNDFDSRRAGLEDIEISTDNSAEDLRVLTQAA